MYPPHIATWYARNRRRLVLGTASAFALLLSLTFLYGDTCGYRGCPSIEEIREFSRTRRGTIALERIPENLRNAFIAVEDRRFVEHNGIDWRAVGRAFVRNAKALEVREGASTLTMQVARIAFIGGEECGNRSLGRKLVEVRLAALIEKALTKDQILQLYLNGIYLGDGVYGVEGASRHYFGKSVGRLSLSEAATLAALPRAPSVYDPIDHPERSMTRRDLVLSLMAKEGYITPAQQTAASEQQLGRASGRRTPSNRPGSSSLITQVRNTERSGPVQNCLAP
jgi:membrane peptidoglycan carboxypeptidase